MWQFVICYMAKFTISRFECTCTYTENTTIIIAILNKSTFKFAYLLSWKYIMFSKSFFRRKVHTLTHTKEVSILTKIFSIYFFFFVKVSTYCCHWPFWQLFVYLQLWRLEQRLVPHLCFSVVLLVDSVIGRLKWWRSK